MGPERARTTSELPCYTSERVSLAVAHGSEVFGWEKFVFGNSERCMKRRGERFSTVARCHTAHLDCTQRMTGSTHAHRYTLHLANPGTHRPYKDRRPTTRSVTHASPAVRGRCWPVGISRLRVPSTCLRVDDRRPSPDHRPTQRRTELSLATVPGTSRDTIGLGEFVSAEPSVDPFENVL